MPLKVAASGAEAPLTELVVPVLARPTLDERRSVLDRVRLAARTQGSPGPPAERSQDFLYDKDGLPD